MGHEHQLQSKASLDMLHRVREICGRLLEVEEAIDGFGHTSFRVNGKTFVMLGENEQGVASMSIKTAKTTQEFLLLQEGKFFKTPYIGQHGWVSIRNAEPGDWGELESLVREGYGRSAPKRLLSKQNLG
ncbi:MmcQ/YjbR family DNA-binding protein [Paenibacillus sp. MBLB4367]|uniref:MmcQ/YjbR family DNA-binding protein n=1 Tax=Paenibacillus sp. MBLB4367 TaxID=3384767 RepID=UPI00390840DE